MSEAQDINKTANGQSRLTEVLGMVKDLRDEADLCRNDGVADIADLLDAAATCIDAQRYEIAAWHRVFYAYDFTKESGTIMKKKHRLTVPNA